MVQGGIDPASSVFTELEYWPWTTFGSIDILHLFEGVFKCLMKLWFDPKFNDGRHARVSKKKLDSHRQLVDYLFCSSRACTVSNT